MAALLLFILTFPFIFVFFIFGSLVLNIILLTKVLTEKKKK